MKKVDPFILIIGAFLLIIILGGIFVAYKSTKTQTLTSYSQTSAEKPILKISTTNIDFGQMRVSEVKTTDIFLENTGAKPLEITNVSTSCDCTFTQLEIGGKLSPRFTMHQNPKWTGKIEAGGKATLKAIYEPARMPVQGSVDRVIYFTTNDPSNPKVEIHIKAIVT